MEKSYQDRAKQFLPYASLRGFEDVVAKRREFKCPRRELLEDAAEELSRRLVNLAEGDVCTVTYYLRDRYVCLVGEVKRIDEIKRRLILDSASIPIDDIFSLEFEN